MKSDKDAPLRDPAHRSPFWICLNVFLLLAVDYGFRMSNLLGQRSQLDRARLMQAQNAGALAQARQLEARLEAFSLDLLEVAKTNAGAKRVVQDFNIHWTPGPAATAPVPGPAPAPANPKQ